MTPAKPWYCNEKREQFRPIATRGSVLYFAIVEMSLGSKLHVSELTQSILGSFYEVYGFSRKSRVVRKCLKVNLLHVDYYFDSGARSPLTMLSSTFNDCPKYKD